MDAPVIIKIEDVSKAYQIGQIGTGTLSRDLERFWTTKIRGKEDPFLKIGEANDRSVKGTSDIVWSLKDLNFEIRQGEAVGIIGKNGAGKSTLLKLLSRVTGPTTGQIKVKGRIASLLEVGTGFHPELSGRENIYLNGAILGMRKREITRKLDEIIDFSGVERYIDTPVKRYSSGMYVRLAFAVAAHLESEILIVDEVLAVGDAEFQKKCLGKMSDISKGEGRTVLFVSHNMAAVQNLCSKGLVMVNGRLEYTGDVVKSVEYYLQNSTKVSDDDLSKRTDRKGAGNFMISSIKKINRQGLESDVFLNGDSIFFEIEVSNKNRQPVSDLRIDFGLNDYSETRISWFSTSLFTGKHSFERDSIIKITMEIPNLPLSAGSYSLTSNLIVDGQNEDWVPNATRFEVENGDFFKSGKLIASKQGNLLIDHKFRS